MKIAVMGSGGLGGFFGGKLALAGHDVWFIARGQHLAALKTWGLRLRGPDPELVIAKPNATDTSAEIGPVDVVLFCVKHYDLDTAAELIKPIVHNDTLIISVLNGIDGPQQIENKLGRGHVFSGAARLSAKIEAPGIIRYLGSANRHSLTIGSLTHNHHPSVERIVKACNMAGFNTNLASDIDEMLWDKLAQLAHLAAMTVLSRIPMEDAIQDPLLLDIGTRVLQEIKVVAEANEVAIDKNIVTNKLALAATYPPKLYASMYHDLVAGRKIEVEAIFGYISKTGTACNVPTPTTDLIYAFLRPHGNGSGSG